MLVYYYFSVMLSACRYSHIIDFTILNFLYIFSDLMVPLYFEIKQTKDRKFKSTVQGHTGNDNGSKY